MEKLFPALKKFSQEVAGATKYFHVALWTVLFLLMAVIALNFSTDFPRSVPFRLGVGLCFWAPLSGLLSLVFWYLPTKIVERKKKEGKEWHLVLSSADLLLTKLVIFPSMSLIVISLFLVHFASESYLQPPPRNFFKIQREAEKPLSYAEKQRAFKIKLEKAEQGNPEDQVRLGSAYNYGNGVGQSYEKANEWYEKAASQGYAKAQFCLGKSYADAEGVKQDYKKALEYYTLAAKQGYSPAQYNLAIAFQNGKGCEPNREKALEWYEKAAEQGDVEAQVLLMHIHLGTGRGFWEGFPYNERQFLYWAFKAADNGELYPAYLLGDFLSFHGKKEIAIPYLQHTSEAGERKHAEAAKRLLRGYGRNCDGSFLAMFWAALKGGKRGLEEYPSKGFSR